MRSAASLLGRIILGVSLGSGLFWVAGYLCLRIWETLRPSPPPQTLDVGLGHALGETFFLIACATLGGVAGAIGGGVVAPGGKRERLAVPPILGALAGGVLGIPPGLAGPSRSELDLPLGILAFAAAGAVAGLAIGILCRSLSGRAFRRARGRGIQRGARLRTRDEVG